LLNPTILKWQLIIPLKFSIAFLSNKTKEPGESFYLSGFLKNEATGLLSETGGG
jgi:hypothetical protein